MLSGIQIVPFSDAHLDAVAEIEELCFSQPWSRNALAEELPNEQAHFLVAVSESEVAGYIGVQEICGEGYIANLAVLPRFRRQGIAKLLIDAALDGAKRRKCVFLSLEVRQSNTAAISLYLKSGFKAVGERKNFYASPAENAVIMTINF